MRHQHESFQMQQSRALQQEAWHRLWQRRVPMTLTVHVLQPQAMQSRPQELLTQQLQYVSSAWSDHVEVSKLRR